MYPNDLITLGMLMLLYIIVSLLYILYTYIIKRKNTIINLHFIDNIFHYLWEQFQYCNRFNYLNIGNIILQLDILLPINRRTF